MPRKFDTAVVTIGIDPGKNTLHLVGLDARGGERDWLGRPADDVPVTYEIEFLFQQALSSQAPVQTRIEDQREIERAYRDWRQFFRILRKRGPV
jgi:hypothetical protein